MKKGKKEKRGQATFLHEKGTGTFLIQESYRTIREYYFQAWQPQASVRDIRQSESYGYSFFSNMVGAGVILRLPRWFHSYWAGS